MSEIADEKNGYNLNISRYVSTAETEAEIELKDVHKSLIEIDKRVKAATAQHNAFLRELNLSLLP
jgi:type I restriction enzyme M protein